jgi:hypothetical protein
MIASGSDGRERLNHLSQRRSLSYGQIDLPLYLDWVQSTLDLNAIATIVILWSSAGHPRRPSHARKAHPVRNVVAARATDPRYL